MTRSRGAQMTGAPTSPSSDISVVSWRAFDATLRGRVVLSDDADFDQVRKGPIARFDNVLPAAIVLCRSAEDVAAAVSFAGRSGIAPTVRSGGHSFAGYSTGSGMVIDVSPMRSISVVGGVATVGAGARLGEVYDAMDQRSLTIPAGCGPTVGIAGLTLGGGLGILGRSHGLTADSLIGAEVVMADARIVTCDSDHEPDLFWALRGAGACGFGVVTSLVFRTMPAPHVTCFHLTWPPSELSNVVDVWQGWAPTAPDALAASLLVTAAGDAAPSVNVFGAMVGNESATDRLLAGLADRMGGDPETSFREEMPYRDAKRYLAALGERFDDGWTGEMSAPGHSYSKSEYFRRPLAREAIDGLIERLTRATASGQVRQLDFTPWGGAYNRLRSDATAFPHREELFLLKHELIVDPTQPDSTTDAGAHWLQKSWETVHPWGSGGVYPNFPDPDLVDEGHTYFQDNFERLVSLKTKYDPANVFRSALATTTSAVQHRRRADHAT
ncbi:MAG: FAD-binding oxidoreductase [Acidimicrobiia bacterium]